MAYLGRQPVLGNFVKLDAITVVNGQAAYTMQNGGVNFTDYTTVNQFLVSLNGTIQAATDSFTVSGSTITFASNLSTGDVIDFIIVFGNSLSAGTVSDSAITTAKLANSAVDLTSKVTGALPVANGGTALTSGFANGITVADSWRLTADITNTDADITANLERDDTAGAGFIGSAMTVSSGIFTFPSTGVYQIVMYANWKVTNENIATLQMFTTVNNSSYTQRADIHASTSASDHYKNSSASVFFDVTDTSQCKVKFTTDSMNANVILRGSSDKNETHFTFVRLGDT